MSYGIYSLYRDKIDVLNVIPGIVTTKIVKFKEGIEACTPEYCVKSSFSCLGHDFECVPYIMHHGNVQVFYFWFTYLPIVWKTMLCKIVYSMALEEFKIETEAKLKK